MCLVRGMERVKEGKSYPPPMRFDICPYCTVSLAICWCPFELLVEGYVGLTSLSQGSDTMTWLRLEHKPHQPGVQQTNRWDHCITILIWKLALTTWWGYVAVAAKISHSEAITMYSLELYKEKENWKKKFNSGGNNSEKNNSTIFLAFQSDFQNYTRLHDK